MDNIYIKKTIDTPEINFNFETGVLEISGQSYPENAADFYEPILDWIADYFEQIKNKMVMNFKLTFFNTSSAKAILQILDLIEDYHKKGRIIEINWLYQEDDESIKESGEEFEEDFEIKFNLIPYK